MTGDQISEPVDSRAEPAIIRLPRHRDIPDVDQPAAVHVTDDLTAGQRFRQQWQSTLPEVPLVVIDSPYRSFVAPFLAYMDAIRARESEGFTTVVLPEFCTAFPWDRWLHNQSARRLRAALLSHADVVTTSVPYSLNN